MRFFNLEVDLNRAWDLVRIAFDVNRMTTSLTRLHLSKGCVPTRPFRYGMPMPAYQVAGNTARSLSRSAPQRDASSHTR